MRRNWELSLWAVSIVLLVASTALLWATAGAVLDPSAPTSVVCDVETGDCSGPPGARFATMVQLLGPVAFGVGLIGILGCMTLRARAPRPPLEPTTEVPTATTAPRDVREFMPPH